MHTRYSLLGARYSVLVARCSGIALPRSSGITLPRSSGRTPPRSSRLVARGALLMAIAGAAVACHRKKAEPAPVVPVQVSPVIRGSIRNFVTADAILYPRDQAN